MEVTGFTFIGGHKGWKGRVSVIRYLLVELNLMVRMIHLVNTVEKMYGRQ